jgi:hypothetical protein
MVSSFAVSRYLTLERRLYRNLEYTLITQNELSVFIMNQPYDESEILIKDQISSKIKSSEFSHTLKTGEGISILLKPGWEVQKGLTPKASVYADGYFTIHDFIGVNRLYASKQLAQVRDYHGDKSEWISAYMHDAYARYMISSSLSLFGGRTARNYGIPNEYGLILSNNPFPYDHYGFSAKGDKIQFSWYFAGLNNMLGYDTEGVTIPIGESRNVQRYMAIQRLDWKIKRRLQIGLSEATLFGGTDQNFVGAFLNPLNFYYLSQRNQKIQMNGSWQVNIFYYIPKAWALYLDLYIDDLIINNDEGVNDRAVHPDRIAIMTKLSIPDLWKEKTLTTVRYVRVWNETYVTYRNYENWVMFNKGIGFPKRSYEGIKFESSYFGAESWHSNISVDFWREGERSLFTTIIDDKEASFPAPPVKKGLSTSAKLQYYYKRIDLNATIKSEAILFQGTPTSINSSIEIRINYMMNSTIAD